MNVAIHSPQTHAELHLQTDSTSFKINTINKLTGMWANAQRDGRPAE